MARKKTPKIRLNVKASLSRRLREIRDEIFGEHGGPELARRLSLPARTWYNYETGVTVPAEVLLGFIEQTGANPMWLLSGVGAKYIHSRHDRLLSQLTPVELIRRGLEELELAPCSQPVVAPENLSEEAASKFVAVAVYSLSQIADSALNPALTEGYVMAFRHWLDHPARTIGIQLTDDAMLPILPAGSIVAVDQTATDPRSLHGQMVAARPHGIPMIRWLEFSGRHVILRPSNNLSGDFPLIPIEFDAQSTDLIVGQVVWSWSRFGRT